MDYLLPGGAICHPELVSARYSRPKGQTVSLPPETWAVGGKYNAIDDKRTPTEKDKDRIVYSALFHRLHGVTQIISPQRDRHALHNRNSHSTKVASVSVALANKFVRKALYDDDLQRQIAEAGGLDPSACEAAALAHDIGHPPYGHAAEMVIDEWLLNASDASRRCQNGFEGNAQSFRSVTVLEQRDLNSYGLELTNVTLAAILKYPWTRSFGNVKYNAKFGSYHTEGRLMSDSRAWFEGDLIGGSKDAQTLEAAIMDISDDITYATHDLQDFILSGVIVPAQVLATLRRLHKWLANGLTSEADGQPFPAPEAEISGFAAKVLKLKANYAGFFDYTMYQRAIEYCIDHVEELELDSKSDVNPVARLRRTGATLIEEAVERTVFDDESALPAWPSAPRIHLDKAAWHRVQILKDITKVFVIETHAVGVQQLAETESLLGLMNKLEEWVLLKKESLSLPSGLLTLLRAPARDVEADPGFAENAVRRAIVDYSCSLTDGEAHQMSRYVRGLEVPRVVI